MSNDTQMASMALRDMSREPHPKPCSDCGREHLQGEHVVMSVPVPDGGTRIAWEGCADCWVRRTAPAPPNIASA